MADQVAKLVDVKKYFGCSTAEIKELSEADMAELKVMLGKELS